MIEINLLADELKVKAKRTNSPKIEPGRFLPAILAVFAIAIIIHFYLAGAVMLKKFHLNALGQKWQELEPQRKALEESQRKTNLYTADAKAMQQLLKYRITWSEKLNKFSELLPGGIWFKELSVNAKGFSLKASVISLQKEELGLINTYINRLKNDNGFFKDFANLELGVIQASVIGGYDVTDFALAGTLKTQ